MDEKIPTRISDSLHNQETSKKKKKGKKGAPLEITSKRRVSRSRQVIPIKKAGSRDPRFHDLFGEFKPNLFNKSYAFLDEYKTREIEEIERRLQQDRDLRRKNSKQRYRKLNITYGFEILKEKEEASYRRRTWANDVSINSFSTRSSET